MKAFSWWWLVGISSGLIMLSYMWSGYGKFEKILQQSNPCFWWKELFRRFWVSAALHSQGLPRQLYNIFKNWTTNLLVGFNIIFVEIVNGNWSEFLPLEECSVTCGEGTQLAERQCNNPPPKNDGTSCQGESQRTQKCHKDPCPSKNKQSKIIESVFTVYNNFSVNGGWSEYEVHVSCSVTCGAGQKTLQRYCNNPTPAYGGANCVGNRISTTDCNLQECPGKQDISLSSKKQKNKWI